MKEKYQLRGNHVVEVPVIGNLVYDDLGKEVIAKFNEKFNGVDRIEYIQKHKADEPISYSNVPRVLGMNQELRKLTNGNITLLSPEQVIRFWDVIHEKGLTYADTDGISLYPNPGPNEELRQEVLKITGKSSKLPLIVSGLGVERTDNSLGFKFTGTDYMRVVEAPFLRKDGRVAYDSSKENLVSSNDGVSVWTPNDQSGLRRLYHGRNDGLDARNGNLLYSNGYGRVQIISGGAASPNLETYIAQFKAEEAKTREKLERLHRAQSVLRGE
ncbi:MAG: hypothetical protein ABIH25_03410 [Candidatus Woesearchaeota archaeon]